LVTGKINLAHRSTAETFLEQVSRGDEPWAGQRVFGACLILRTDLYAVIIANFTTGALTHGFVTLRPCSLTQPRDQHSTLDNV